MRSLLLIRNKLNFHPRQIYSNFKVRYWNQEQQSSYWKNKSSEQPIFKYDIDINWLQIKQPLLYALSCVGKRKQDIAILEIGCNIGNNLNHLLNYGYTQLTGIEIKKDVIELISKEITVIEGDITKMIDIPVFDIIFTSGVLMHIADLSFLNKLSANYFITFESELHKASFIYKRNYKKIFEKIGYSQVGYKKFIWNSSYATRLFRKMDDVKKR